ncbi:MAG: hypothetical protein QOJ64_557 [Acidobacteriota bacterium]|jgi:hypothetical protein|nr:hypothetical protein [Acidobacteriota bacterium]
MKTRLLSVAACLCFAAWQNCWAQKRSDVEWQKHVDISWVDARFSSALDTLLPFNDEAKMSFRIYGDAENDVLEFSCALILKPDDSIEAVIRKAEAASLYDQILSLHRHNRTWKIETMTRRLNIRELRLTQQSCPVLRKLEHEFDDLNLPVLSAKDRARKTGYAFLHPTMYIFEAYVSGGRMRLEIMDGEHEFARWAERAKSALESCAHGGSKHHG